MHRLDPSLRCQPQLVPVIIHHLVTSKLTRPTISNGKYHPRKSKLTRPKTSSHLNLPALCCDHPCPDGHIKLSPRGWLNPDVIALNEQDMNNTVFLYVVSYDLLFPSFIAVLVRRDKPMQSRPINEDEAAFERVAEGRIRARLVNFSLPQRVFHHSPPLSSLHQLLIHPRSLSP